MQIKFNKIVKPVAPKMDGVNLEEVKTAQPVVPQPNAVPVNTVQASAAQILEAQAKEAQVSAAPVDMPPKAEEQAPAPQTSTVQTAPAEIIPQIPKTVKNTNVSSQNLEETLREFLGQQIRVYTADSESASGRLDVVEDGWIRLSNARSAGSDYYSDEDIINTSNIVRVRYSRAISKDDYRDFMNITTPNK